MESPRPSATPPATARPRNSSSSIASAQVASTAQQPASMAAAPRTARGSTPTASRSASKLADADKPTRAASKDSLRQKLVKREETPQPSKADEQLVVLRAEFEGLRSHLTCKICDRLLYQPYTIACGHTYCYSCLCTWFVNNKVRKTCPDCRVLVKELPAPAYVIRDLTCVFISRAELLPAGDTMDEHMKWQQEEADAVQQDRDNADPRTGGLFKGAFKAHAHPARPSLHVVRDQEDGVDRCPICTWELEEGACTQCGLIFDESGELSWGDSFTGFSDMDEMSEHDHELDGDMDMEEGEFEGFDEHMENWQDYLPQGSFVMRRFLGASMRPNAAQLHRRPLSHSEAGSRRSYTQSIVSDLHGDEMDTVEEEDEEEDDDEQDSEMNDFIVDDDENASTSAESSTPAQTPQPANNRARAQGRARRVVESETSSTISSAIEEGEEDEEDAGPVARGRRNPVQARVLNRANGSMVSHTSSSTTQSDVSTDEVDEDTQALLREEGWMLQQDDDEMGEDEGEDSDGGRTTVGWEPLAISNDRVRMGGSLTPTADRPRPSAPIRPPSRTGARFVNASRGLRRSSALSATAPVPYEDGEADDDDSEQDGDPTAAMESLRTRRSQIQLRNAMNAATPPPVQFANYAFIGAANDPELEEHSDNSQSATRRRNPRTIRREYDPRISIMFAAHQQALQEHHAAGALIDVEPRSLTPLTRPRTSNRNRPSPAQTYSPFRPPSRLRTPLMNDTLDAGAASRMPISPPRRSAMSPAFSASMANVMRGDRTSSISSGSNSSVMYTPGTSTPSSQYSANTMAQAQTAAMLDMFDRPPSRVGPRPPSAASRRNSANFSPVHANMGMHVQGSGLPPFQAPNNPWAAYVQSRGLRPRNSRAVLREQSSTATLRPASSRVNLRDVANPPQNLRTQVSRLGLRPQPSRRQLNSQPSVQAMRVGGNVRSPQSPGPNVQAGGQPIPRPARQATLTPDERASRAQELIQTRMRALGQADSAPARTNPFTQFRRVANPADSPTAPQGPMPAHHTRTGSGDSMQSANSSGTTSQGAPSSPGLRSRRSNRNMVNGPPPGVFPAAQGTFPSPTTAYPNAYYRPRQGSLNGLGPAYESPLNPNARVLNPMPAGPLI